MEDKLKTGSVTTISTFLAGVIPSIDANTQDLITFYFQITAFAVSIIVGLLTACYYFKKLREKTIRK